MVIQSKNMQIPRYMHGTWCIYMYKLYSVNFSLCVLKLLEYTNALKHVFGFSTQPQAI